MYISVSVWGNISINGTNTPDLPSISSMDINAASSYDELSDPAVMLPKPRQTQRVITTSSFWAAAADDGSISRSSIRDRFSKQGDPFQMGR